MIDPFPMSEKKLPTKIFFLTSAKEMEGTRRHNVNYNSANSANPVVPCL
jgi:hypothetical protein